MIFSAGDSRSPIRWWRRLVQPSLLLALVIIHSTPSAASDPVELEALLGIAVFPGAELIAMEGPAPELVNLQRPGWEFVDADVLVADFLVEVPIAQLRRFYRALCVRDPLLLMVSKDVPPETIISVRHAGRHPEGRGSRHP